MGPEIAQELQHWKRFIIEEPQIPQEALDEYAAKLARQRHQHDQMKAAHQTKLDMLRAQVNRPAAPATPGPPGTPGGTIPQPPPHPNLLIEITELESLMEEADAVLEQI